MKKITLIRQGLLTVLLMAMVAPLVAQDLYLPATTKSKEAKALYTEAMDAVYDVEFAKMQKVNKKALEADPNFFMAYFLQSLVGDKASREAALDKMADYTGKMNKGEKVLKEGAVKMKADPKYIPIAESRQLVKLYPKNIFAKTMLAYNLGGNDETRAEALSILDECAKMSPELASIHNTKGYMHMANKEFDKAKASFDKYIEMAPDKANPYDSKGDYFMAVKSYKEAAKSYKKAYEVNDEFTMSKKKGKEAKWMAKREMIASEVKVQAQQFVADYNSRDVGKYVKNYYSGPEFCFVVNGEALDSYKEFVDRVYKAHDMYTAWNVEILSETVEVPAENIATVTQIFAYTATPKEGDKVELKGSFTSVWRNIDDNWKIVHAINTNPIKE
ncbi:nuclear transport factor 2 family protein [Carboxylicivirga sp. RSCT41]|uniref:nuclear transport factor 2 family protein n=1 Tax=Carboxylicivirga agarovorans TaxID=3417570 RepID=UPI003D343498